MYLLRIALNEKGHDIGIFENEEKLKEFIISMPGVIKGEDIFNMQVDTSKFGDYSEVKFGKTTVPLTRFMFEEEGIASLDVYEVEKIDGKTEGIISGATIVDAYSINNNEIKNYIEKREKAYMDAKSILEEMGYDVLREYRGSEDGEAITIIKDGEARFFTHLDPYFINEFPKDKKEQKKWIGEYI